MNYTRLPYQLLNQLNEGNVTHTISQTDCLNFHDYIAD